jgi:hypothetical protein
MPNRRLPHLRMRADRAAVSTIYSIRWSRRPTAMR